ncbi:iron complex transport system substrate-binding protein [Devosia lucknowensis]|uniref:Iron complex transport system substrate-binding protein n=1 Tax=Devosia lucknowensis TaxID=1096929 RepID=A0A1Y6G820_9HYPH|nr:ABC transporter substrate-binding protein [Devosia lucknowensis]SMQ86332.1 iron complex transport system substrate-binding protein [Devosia lucknowensis]
MRHSMLISLATLVLASPALSQPFPVTLTHAKGEITISEAPQRVLSLGLNDQDFLYALGVAPVAVHEWWGEQPYATWPWAEAARDTVGAEPAVLMGYEVDLEWIASQNPDLIVATYYELDVATYELLSQIAPVLATPQGFDDYGAPWQEQLELIALATTGTTDKADAIAADLDARLAALRAKYPQFSGHTASMADLRDGQFTLWASQHAPTRFLESLGFSFPGELDEMADDAGWIYLSAEKADELDRLDVVVWPNGKQAEIEDISTYANTRLFKEGRSVFPGEGEDALAAALWFYTPLSIGYAAEHFAPKLAAALEGRTRR